MTATLIVERFDEAVELTVEADVWNIGRGELEVGDVTAYGANGRVVHLEGNEETRAIKVLVEAACW